MERTIRTLTSSETDTVISSIESDSSVFQTNCVPIESQIKEISPDAEIKVSVQEEEIIVITSVIDGGQVDTSVKTEETLETSLPVEDSSKTEEEVKIGIIEDAEIKVSVQQEERVVARQYSDISQVDISVKTEETIDACFSVADFSKTEEEVKMSTTEDGEIKVSTQQEEIVVSTTDIGQVDISVKTEETLETSLSVEDRYKIEEEEKFVEEHGEKSLSTFQVPLLSGTEVKTETSTQESSEITTQTNVVLTHVELITKTAPLYNEIKESQTTEAVLEDRERRSQTKVDISLSGVEEQKVEEENLQEETDFSFKMQLQSFQVPILRSVEETADVVSQTISVSKEIERSELQLESLLEKPSEKLESVHIDVTLILPTEKIKLETAEELVEEVNSPEEKLILPEKQPSVEVDDAEKELRVEMTSDITEVTKVNKQIRTEEGVQIRRKARKQRKKITKMERTIRTLTSSETDTVISSIESDSSVFQSKSVPVESQIKEISPDAEIKVSLQQEKIIVTTQDIDGGQVDTSVKTKETVETSLSVEDSSKTQEEEKLVKEYGEKSLTTFQIPLLSGSEVKTETSTQESSEVTTHLELTTKTATVYHEIKESQTTEAVLEDREKRTQTKLDISLSEVEGLKVKEEENVQEEPNFSFKMELQSFQVPILRSVEDTLDVVSQTISVSKEIERSELQLESLSEKPSEKLESVHIDVTLILPTEKIKLETAEELVEEVKSPEEKLLQPEDQPSVEEDDHEKELRVEMTSLITEVTKVDKQLPTEEGVQVKRKLGKQRKKKTKVEKTIRTLSSSETDTVIASLESDSSVFQTKSVPIESQMKEIPPDAEIKVSVQQEEIIVTTQNIDGGQVDTSVKTEETVETSLSIEDSSKTEEEEKIATTKEAVIALSVSQEQIVVTTQHTEVDQVDISVKTEETVETSLSVEDSSKTEEVKIGTTKDVVITVSIHQDKEVVTTHDKEVDQVDISVKTEDTVETSLSVEDSSKPEEEVKITTTEDAEIKVSVQQEEKIVTTQYTTISQVDISVKTEETVETSLNVADFSNAEEEVKIVTTEDAEIKLSVQQEEIAVTTQDIDVGQVDISVNTEETVQTSQFVADFSETEEEAKISTTEDAEIKLFVQQEEIVVTTQDTNFGQADIFAKTEETVETTLSVEDVSKTRGEVKISTTEDAEIKVSIKQEEIVVSTTDVGGVDISVKTEETVETSLSEKDSSKTEEEEKFVEEHGEKSLPTFQIPLFSGTKVKTETSTQECCEITTQSNVVLTHVELTTKTTLGYAIKETQTTKAVLEDSERGTQTKVNISPSEVEEQKADTKTESSGWRPTWFRLPKFSLFSSSEDKSRIDSVITSQEVDTVTKTDQVTAEVLTTKIDKVDFTEHTVRSKKDLDTTEVLLKSVTVKDGEETLQEETDLSFKIKLQGFQVPLLRPVEETVDVVSQSISVSKEIEGRELQLESLSEKPSEKLASEQIDETFILPKHSVSSITVKAKLETAEKVVEEVKSPDEEVILAEEQASDEAEDYENLKVELTNIITEVIKVDRQLPTEESDQLKSKTEKQRKNITEVEKTIRTLTSFETDTVIASIESDSSVAQSKSVSTESEIKEIFQDGEIKVYVHQEEIAVTTQDTDIVDISVKTEETVETSLFAEDSSKTEEQLNIATTEDAEIKVSVNQENIAVTTDVDQVDISVKTEETVERMSVEDSSKSEEKVKITSTKDAEIKVSVHHKEIVVTTQDTDVVEADISVKTEEAVETLLSVEDTFKTEEVIIPAEDDGEKSLPTFQIALLSGTEVKTETSTQESNEPISQTNVVLAHAELISKHAILDHEIKESQFTEAVLEDRERGIQAKVDISLPEVEEQKDVDTVTKVDTIRKTEWVTTEIITSKTDQVDLTEYATRAKRDFDTTEATLQCVTVKDEETLQEEADLGFKIQLENLQVSILRSVDETVDVSQTISASKDVERSELQLESLSEKPSEKSDSLDVTDFVEEVKSPGEQLIISEVQPSVEEDDFTQALEVDTSKVITEVTKFDKKLPSKESVKGKGKVRKQRKKITKIEKTIRTTTISDLDTIFPLKDSYSSVSQTKSVVLENQVKEMSPDDEIKLSVHQEDVEVIKPDTDSCQLDFSVRTEETVETSLSVEDSSKTEEVKIVAAENVEKSLSTFEIPLLSGTEAKTETSARELGETTTQTNVALKHEETSTLIKESEEVVLQTFSIKEFQRSEFQLESLSEKPAEKSDSVLLDVTLILPTHSESSIIEETKFDTADELVEKGKLNTLTIISDDERKESETYSTGLKVNDSRSHTTFDISLEVEEKTIDTEGDSLRITNKKLEVFEENEDKKVISIEEISSKKIIFSADSKSSQSDVVSSDRPRRVLISQQSIPGVGVTVHQESISIADDDVPPIEMWLMDKSVDVSKDVLNKTLQKDLLPEKDVLEDDTTLTIKTSEKYVLETSAEESESTQVIIQDPNISIQSPTSPRSGIVFPKFSTRKLSISVIEESINIGADENIKSYVDENASVEVVAEQELKTTKESTESQGWKFQIPGLKGLLKSKSEKKSSTTADCKEIIPANEDNVLKISKEDILANTDRETTFVTEEKPRNPFKLPSFKLPSISLTTKKEKSIDYSVTDSSTIGNEVEANKMSSQGEMSIEIKRDSDVRKLKADVISSDNEFEVKKEKSGLFSIKDQSKIKFPKLELSKPSMKSLPDNSSLTVDSSNLELSQSNENKTLEIIMEQRTTKLLSVDTTVDVQRKDICDGKETSFEEEIKIKFPYFKTPAISAITPQEVCADAEATEQDLHPTVEATEDVYEQVTMKSSKVTLIKAKNVDISKNLERTQHDTVVSEIKLDFPISPTLKSPESISKLSRKGFKISLPKVKMPVLALSSSKDEKQNFDITAIHDGSGFTLPEYDLSGDTDLGGVDISCVANKSVQDITEAVDQTDSLSDQIIDVTKQSVSTSSSENTGIIGNVHTQATEIKENISTTTSLESHVENILITSNLESQKKIIREIQETDMSLKEHGNKDIEDTQTVKLSHISYVSFPSPDATIETIIQSDKELYSDSSSVEIPSEYDNVSPEIIKTVEKATFSSGIVKEYEISSEIQTPSYGFALLKTNLPEVSTTISTHSSSQKGEEKGDQPVISEQHFQSTQTRLDETINEPHTSEHVMVSKVHVSQVKTFTLKSPSQSTVIHFPLHLKDSEVAKTTKEDPNSTEELKITQEKEVNQKSPTRFKFRIPNIGFSSSGDETESDRLNQGEEKQIDSKSERDSTAKDKGSWFKFPKLGFSTEKQKSVEKEVTEKSELVTVTVKTENKDTEETSAEKAKAPLAEPEIFNIDDKHPGESSAK